MTDDVARLVLRNNDEQNRTLSVETALASDLLPAHRRFLEVLEGAGAIDRAQEALPSAAELDRRVRDGDGLTDPELSVLLAHAKISLRGALLESDLPDEPWVRATLCAYFPDELGQGLADRLAEHPLHREIAATVLVNDVVAAGGLTFAFRAAEETGSDMADVVRAFAVTRTVFDLSDQIAAVERLDGTVTAAVQARLRHEQQRLLDRAARWFLQARPEGIDVTREVERFGPTLTALAPQVPDLLRGQDLAAVQEEVDELVAEGVPREQALRTTGLLFVYPLLDVIEVALATGRPAERVAASWFAVSDRYGFDRLLTAVSKLSRTDRWETLARAALRDDLYALLREFAAAVAADPRSAELDAPAAVEAWEGERAAAVRRARQTLSELEQAGRADLTALSVALRTLRTVLRRR
jgi:glutamate dehydrogenase